MADPSLRRLLADIPLADDRMMLELVAGLEKADDLSAHRGRKRGFFGNVLDVVTGRDRMRSAATDRALLQSQRMTREWVIELSEQSRLTDLALARTARKLYEIGEEVQYVGQLSRQALLEVRELAGILNRVAEALNRRLDEHEWRLDEHERRLDQHDLTLRDLDRRVLAVELGQRAWLDFDTAIRRWEANGAYGSLPWVCQVVLLAHEVASGAAGLYEFVTGDRGWRERLRLRLTADPRSRAAWEGSRSLAAVLDEVWPALPTLEHREMVAELLGVGLPPELRTTAGPLSTALSTTLELAARPADIRPRDVADEALDRARSRSGWIPGSLTAAELVRLAVQEQADAALAVRRELHKDQR